VLQSGSRGVLLSSTLPVVSSFLQDLQDRGAGYDDANALAQTGGGKWALNALATAAFGCPATDHHGLPGRPATLAQLPAITVWKHLSHLQKLALLYMVLLLPGVVGQQALLPTHQDSKLWLIKTKIGSEREAVVQLLSKHYALMRQGAPLLIKSAISIDHIKVGGWRRGVDGGGAGVKEAWARLPGRTAAHMCGEPGLGTAIAAGLLTSCHPPPAVLCAAYAFIVSLLAQVSPSAMKRDLLSTTPASRGPSM
jgi:hypothetical protein